MVLEKTLESLLDSKEIQPVHSKGNLARIFFGRTDAKVQTPIISPSDVKNWLIWKAPDAGKDWRWGEKGTTEDWDGWMASPTWSIWVWANSGRWRRTGKPGVLQSIGLQRVRHDWATKQQQGKLVFKNRNRKIINSLLKNEHFRKWSDFLKSTIFKFLSQSKQINYLKSGQRQRHKSVSRINLQPTKCYPRK